MNSLRRPGGRLPNASAGACWHAAMASQRDPPADLHPPGLSRHANASLSVGIKSAGKRFARAPVAYRLPREAFTRDWTLEETANLLFVESDYDFACHHVIPITAFKDGGCSVAKAREARTRSAFSWFESYQAASASL
jgi:hypothetical protein